MADRGACAVQDPGPGPSFGGEHRPFEWGWRAVGLFPVSVVVGAAVPAAVCRWGLARAFLMWGGSLGGKHHPKPATYRRHG